MRRVVLCLVFLLFVAGCAGSSSSSGNGVQVSVLNQAELSEVYIPFDEALPSGIGIDRLDREGDFVRISNLNLLVHNRGYADSLVALYVTGYDPNLFAVLPSGPYFSNQDVGYCYKDIQLVGKNDYSVHAICAVSDEVLVGGGVSQNENGRTTSASVYNANVGDWLANLVGRISGIEDNIFAQYGSIFNGMNLQCNLQEQNDGSRDYSCSVSSNFLDFTTRSSSRGTLLLAWYGGDVRNCRNGCTLVPSPRMARPFIAGDSERYPGGEALYVDYQVFLNRDRWPGNLNQHNQLFQVSACYLYTTYATPVVCIDPTPATSDGDVCRPGVQEIGHGQPAPLKITSIDQRSQGSRVMFTIHVENQLNGRLFHPGAVDYCAPGAPETYSRELRDVAKVIDARVLGDSQPLDCRDGTIRMRDGRGSINCFYELPPNAFQSGAYQSTLNIELGYLYRDIQSVSSTVHRI